MSHERSDRINLGPTEPRCEPGRPCSMRGRCARYMGNIPKGSPLRDYSTDGGGGTATCPGYFAIGHFDPKTAAKVPVKPSVRGLT